MEDNPNNVADITARPHDYEFPIDVFPPRIRDIIWEMKESLNYPVDYTASSMMVAVALGLGNTHVLRFMEEWNIKCILYMALVGRPGANKSQPLHSVFHPFFDFDIDMFRKYKEDLDRYKKVKALGKKKRMELGFEKGLPRPVLKRFLVSDITQEAMIKVLQENRRGICLYMDELLAWVKNFTRYKRGSEEQFYISLSKGDDYLFDRKEDINDFANKPFVCVIGTLPPCELQNMFRGSRLYNGFFECVLFCFPEEKKKDYWNSKDFDSSAFDDWNAILHSLIRMDVERDENGRIIPMVMEYSPEARKEVMSWQHAWADMINVEDDEKIKGIYCKFEIFIHRFCMIIQTCKWLCDGDSHVTIDAGTVRKAVKLVEYFKGMALRTLRYL